jgi:hypothetical protein
LQPRILLVFKANVSQFTHRDIFGFEPCSPVAFSKLGIDESARFFIKVNTAASGNFEPNKLFGVWVIDFALQLVRIVQQRMLKFHEGLGLNILNHQILVPGAGLGNAIRLLIQTAAARQRKKAEEQDE